MGVINYTYESIYVGMWMCECDVCVCIRACIYVCALCLHVRALCLQVRVYMCRMCEYVRESYVDVCVVFM